MSASRSIFAAGTIAALLVSSMNVAAADGAERATPQRVDFLDATYMPGPDRVYVTGHHGMVGVLEVNDSDATVKLISEHPNVDFTAIERISDNEALIGSSTGHLFRFDGTTISEVAALSEYDEPILDIAADASGVWVVGARGLIARSADGKEFEAVEIRDVTLPKIEFPGGHPADWYLGVANLDVESIEFTATVGGQPAINDEHYVLYPDEGFIQVQTELDMDPPPTVSLQFNPGPPFRIGDVSWNVVLLSDGKVTLAGEFGMVLQSEDNGATWIRRDTEIVPREPEPAYWMTGVQKGDGMWLAGAAGVSQRSDDGGVTWTDNPKPGREGIFGITLTADDKPIIAGAVGLIGTMVDDDWEVADRTQLKLLSWLKPPVALPDGSVLLLGGRSAAIRFRDGQFSRLPVNFVN